MKNWVYSVQRMRNILTFAPDFKITVREHNAPKFNFIKGKKIMKKIMMTLAAVCVAATMNAQVYVGGSLGFQTTSCDGDSETLFQILPEIGYSLNDNWAVGVTVGYGEDKAKVSGATAKIKSFKVAPYARYTFLKLDKVNLFLDGGVDYIHNDYAGTKTNAFGVGIKPGVAVNLNDKLSFVAHAGFLGYNREKADGAEAVNTFGVGVDGNNLSFGVYYNF